LGHFLSIPAKQEDEGEEEGSSEGMEKVRRRSRTIMASRSDMFFKMELSKLPCYICQTTSKNLS
jgi:hypothetical protein